MLQQMIESHKKSKQKILLNEIFTLVLSDDSDSSDCDDEDESEILLGLLRISTHRRYSFLTEIICMHPEEFLKLFHISKESFEYVFEKYKLSKMSSITFPHKRFVEDQLKMDLVYLLLFLSEKENSPAIIAQFLCSDIKTIVSGIKRIVKFLLQECFHENIFKFPNKNAEQKIMNSKFQKIILGSDLIGILGITSFPFDSNAQSEIALQIIVDPENIITAIDVRHVFDEYEICEMINDPLSRFNKTISPSFKIYGSSELYPAINYVKKFSLDLYNLNNIIDRTFDMIKKQFPKLNFLHGSDNFVQADKLVICACILYNICMKNKH